MIKIKNRCCYTVTLILCGTLFLTGLTGCKSKHQDRSRRKIQMRRKLIQKTDRMMVAVLQSPGKNRQNQMIQMQVMGQEVIPGNILQMLI